MAKYTRSNPTAWPNGAYYFLRFIQFICSIGVMGTLSYFIYYLLKGKYGIPVEFIVLYSAAVVSFLVIILTTVAKCCSALNAKVAACVDVFAFIAWGVSFGLLTHAMHGLVFHGCTDGAWAIKGHKPGKTGVYVCRMFKATWAFAATAILFFIFSIVLDIIVIRRVGSHKYAPANPKSMNQTKQYATSYSQDTSYGSGGLPSHG